MTITTPLIEAQEAQEIDRGGWARLDVSDLHDISLPPETSEDTKSSSVVPCGWCIMEPASGEYLVVADNGHFRVCPTCWGRSPGYIELRSAGWAHEPALAHVIGKVS